MSFFRSFFPRSPLVDTVGNDNGEAHAPFSPEPFNTDRTNRLIKSAPPVLQRPPRELQLQPPLEARSVSLSNDFTLQLPLALPNLAEIQLDVVEWFCHVCLLETDPGRLAFFRHELSQAEALARHCHTLRLHNRLRNRLEMVDLWNDIGCMHMNMRRRDDINDDAVDGTDDANVSNARANVNADGAEETSLMYSTDILAAQWSQIKLQLELLKIYMLRPDANENFDTDTDTVGAIRILPPAQASLDEQLEKHDMFQQDYRQVVLLLQVQQALASLRESTFPEFMERRDPKGVERAIGTCQRRLEHVFQDKENQSESRGIPEALAFLLSGKDNKNKRRSSNPATDDNTWVVNLQQDVTAFCLDETHEFSHAHLKEKVSLPTVWYTSGECEPGSERMLGFLLSYPCQRFRSHPFNFSDNVDAIVVNQVVREHSRYTSLGPSRIRRCSHSCCREQR
jgi:hypothetical protein